MQFYRVYITIEGVKARDFYIKGFDANDAVSKVIDIVEAMGILPRISEAYILDAIGQRTEVV